MSGWSIDPQAVSAVLSAEQDEVDTVLSPALEGLGAAQEGAISATETEAPLVASAVAGWFSLHVTDVTSMSNTINNVLTNTVYAVDCYLAQDEEAALEYQRQAK